MQQSVGGIACVHNLVLLLSFEPKKSFLRRRRRRLLCEAADPAARRGRIALDGARTRGLLVLGVALPGRGPTRMRTRIPRAAQRRAIRLIVVRVYLCLALRIHIRRAPPLQARRRRHLRGERRARAARRRADRARVAGGDDRRAIRRAGEGRNERRESRGERRRARGATQGRRLWGRRVREERGEAGAGARGGVGG